MRWRTRRCLLAIPLLVLAEKGFDAAIRRAATTLVVAALQIPLKELLIKVAKALV